MDGVKASGFQQYLAEAQSWETNRLLRARKSERLAWYLAAAAALLCTVSVVAVAALAPLKTVEPYVIRVDNSTGMVDTVSALRDGKSNYEESVSKFFVQWYVRYREGFSRDLAEEYYYSVGLMSSPQEQQRYFSVFDPHNPNAPLNLYGESAKVRISVKSTSFIQPHVAMVRYTREIYRGSDQPLLTHWAATIAFRYTDAPMAERDRGINPLGFQVTEYRNDPDSLIEQRVSAPAVAPVTPSTARLYPADPSGGAGPVAVPVPPAGRLPVVPALQTGP